METIVVETSIAAPADICFLLSLNIDLHVESASHTGERAVAGVTHGLIGPGKTVTWRGRHFGIMLTHRSLISKYERPYYFQDVMIEGLFKQFVHDHYFSSGQDGTTVMCDELCFASPFGWLGGIADSLVLQRYLRNFLVRRNAVIQQIAERPDAGWQKYIHTND